MKCGNDYEGRAKGRKGEGEVVGRRKRAYGGHTNHKKQDEMKNLIKPSWLAGARSGGSEGGVVL